MNEQLIDFDFLEELSGGDPKYKYDVLDIFLSTVDEGLENLGKLVQQASDYEAIYKQAHALKSSAGIVKVKDMYDRLAGIEMMGRDIVDRGIMKGKEEIPVLFSRMMDTYKQAHSLLIAERDKNKTA